MACLASATATDTSIGKIVFCGDSITQGAGRGIGPGYRYQVFKNFVDNDVAYTPVGTQNTAGKATPDYRGVAYNRANQGHSGWWASDLNGTKGSHPSIVNWTGQSKKLPNGQPYNGASYTPDTVYLMAGTNDFGHNTGNPPSTDEVVSRIQKCMEQYKKSNPKAKIYISSIPLMSKNDVKSGATYNERVEDVNQKLKKEAAAKGYMFIDTMEGIRGKTDADSNFALGDQLHPNAHGELIMAGNIARAMGIGQRNAGLARKAASDTALFKSLSKKSVPKASGTAWKPIAQQRGFILKSTGESYIQQNAASTGFADSTGYTCECSLKLLPGKEVNTFSIAMGDGTNHGLLNITEDKTSWGDQVLYISDNTKGINHFRVVYLPGNAADGILPGYYVWRDGVLIGEALASATGATHDGLQAGALPGSTGVNAGLAALSWSNKGTFAPDLNKARPGAPKRGSK